MLRLLRVVHRGLGLALALVVLGVAGSGGLLLLRDPYHRWVYPPLAEPLDGRAAGSRAAVLDGIETRWRAEGVRQVKLPRPGSNAFHVWLGDGSQAFVHSRTGEVIDRWRWHERAPAFLFELHAHLLADDAGKTANGIVALVVAFMVLTGLVVWWPGRRAFGPRSVVPRRVTRGALVRSHAAVGLFAAIPILVSALTGAGIVFYAPVLRVVSGWLDTHPSQSPDAVVTRRDVPMRPPSELLAIASGALPDGETVFYTPPSRSNARALFRKRLAGEWHPNGRSYVLLDPYTARPVQVIDARTHGTGTRFMQALYPVHAATVGRPWLLLLAGVSAGGLAWLGLAGAWAWVAARRRLLAARQPLPAGGLASRRVTPSL